MREKLIKNSSWSIASKLSATVLFFTADILIARILNIEEYAEWAFFYSILSMMFYVFWFGVNGSVKVFISKTQAETEGRRVCLQAGIRVRTIVTLTLAFLTGFLVLTLPKFYFFQALSPKYPYLRLLCFRYSLIIIHNIRLNFRRLSLQYCCDR